MCPHLAGSLPGADLTAREAPRDPSRLSRVSLFFWTVLIRLRQLQNAVGPGAARVRCRFGSSPHTDQNTAESDPGGRRVLPKRPGDDLTNHYQGQANGNHRMHAVLNTEVARNRYEH